MHLLLALAPLLCSAQAARQISAATIENVTVTVHMPYLIVLPHDYNEAGGAWPVILYLHGAGERGSDIGKVRRVAAVQEALHRVDYPFILLAPQVTDPDQAWVNISRSGRFMARTMTLSLNQYRAND